MGNDDGLTADEACAALLSVQFFPSSRRRGMTLPPYFDSSSFSLDTYTRLASAQPKAATYSSLRVRRFDGLIRHMGVPHPVPYARLISAIHMNWDKIYPRISGEHSQIRPKRPIKNGKILVFDYDAKSVEVQAESRAAQGMNYRVTADINNFFPSLYTHSIDWALRGLSEAKGDRNSGWGAKIDAAVRNCNAGETNGLIIGPASSNLLSEIVAQRVDEHLRNTGYRAFTRHVDDYTAYFKTREQCERFIQDLDRGLSAYRLQLNTRKTQICSLRHGGGEPWLQTVTAHLPSKSCGPARIARFFHECEFLAAAHPAKSVLTYAVRTLLGKISVAHLDEKQETSGGILLRKRRHQKRDLMVMHEMLRVTHFHPHLAQDLARILRHCKPILTNSEAREVANTVGDLLYDSALRGESDTTSWFIYCIRTCLKQPIKKGQSEQILDMHDDITALALVASTKKYAPSLLSWLRQIDLADTVALQSHWLVRYELYRVKDLKDDDLSVDEKWFKTARKEAIAFTTMRPS